MSNGSQRPRTQARSRVVTGGVFLPYLRFCLAVCLSAALLMAGAAVGADQCPRHCRQGRSALQRVAHVAGRLRRNLHRRRHVAHGKRNSAAEEARPDALGLRSAASQVVRDRRPHGLVLRARRAPGAAHLDQATGRPALAIALFAWQNEIGEGTGRTLVGAGSKADECGRCRSAEAFPRECTIGSSRRYWKSRRTG